MKILRHILLGLTAAAFLALLPAAPVLAEVFHSREGALKLAFPDADRVEARDLVLTSAQAAEVARRAGVEEPSRLMTAYQGFRGDEALGWAFLDTHPVRTHEETLMVVLEPDGRVRGTHLLAFHEPAQYAPVPRWLAQFTGHRLSPGVAVGRDVDGISGATMTARAVTATVRRVLAVWDVRLASRVATASAP